MIVKLTGNQGEEIFIDIAHVAFVLIPSLITPGDGLGQVFIPPQTVLKVQKEGAVLLAKAMQNAKE